MTRLAWFDSFGVLGGAGLLSVLAASGAALGALSVSSRHRAPMRAPRDHPDSPDLQEILALEASILTARRERLDVATEAGWALAALAGRAGAARGQARPGRNAGAR